MSFPTAERAGCPALPSETPAAKQVLSRRQQRVYVPSTWEEQWVSSISALATDNYWHKACTLLATQKENVREWLRTRDAREKGKNSTAEWSPRIFSYHMQRGSSGLTVTVPIEPLVGMLRHPNYYCIVPGLAPSGTRFPDASKGARWKVNRGYLLPPWHGEAVLHHRGRSLFFDLGASLYTRGLGGASQSWFVEGYARRGVPFDHIFAWEAMRFTDDEILHPLPRALRNQSSVYRAPLSREDGFRLADEQLSYFNFGVTADVGDTNHPWRLLQRWAQPHDFVVVKLDIDSPGIEEPLVRQLLEDEGFSRLIDELYFEHHVHEHPLARKGFGWDVSVRQTNCTVSDSFRVFSMLRHAGIRAHSWV